jgi:hypothetical protein
VIERRPGLSICLKLSNVPCVFGALPAKEVVCKLEPLFTLAWERGVRMFWADQCASSQRALGMLLARLGEDVDQSELLLDLMSAENKSPFEYLTYLNKAFDHLWVKSVDCVMVGPGGGSLRKSWPPYERLGRELVNRKQAHGCGASLTHASQLATAVTQKSVKRISVALKQISRDLQPSLKILGSTAVVMVDENDDQDSIGRLFTSGCVLGVDVLGSKPAFAKSIIEGYTVA